MAEREWGREGEKVARAVAAAMASAGVAAVALTSENCLPVIIMHCGCQQLRDNHHSKLLPCACSAALLVKSVALYM